MKQVSEKYRQEFNKVAPSKSMMSAIVEKFRHTGSVLCQRKGSSGRQRTVFTNNNQGRVLDQIIHSPKRSLRRTAYKLNISETSHLDCSNLLVVILIAFKLDNDSTLRTNVQEKLTVKEYKSHIHLNGYINRQTTRFLGFEHPDVIAEKSLHSERVTTWCAVSGHGIICPYFVEDENEHPVTVNQKRYKENNIKPFDGATNHAARRSLVLLREHFENRIISRGTNFEYPSHSPDLTPPDAYVWGMLKESVFWSEDPPANVGELRRKIITYFQKLQQPLFINMLDNL
ncbi:hypothetical protein ILUMI_14764 [Ignelater luminosus]|uniref:DUF4817 domain-containing protein n=1 Tax=Ignelater luminosus TaxID=2038154 RepID=A0A8K0CRU3_IGNLU|nr:hypothetical protein ILUMI_14764 [Ignelater luminosus]